MLARCIPLLLSTLWVTALPGQQPLFSEDFESGRIDSKLWEERTHGAATIEVEEGEAAHGKYALRIHCPATTSGGYAFLVFPTLPASVSGHFFGRAYVRIDGVAQSPVDLVFAGSAGWPFSKFRQIGVLESKFRLAYRNNKSAQADEDVRDGEALPVAKWFLLEWEVNDDPATLAIWVDGHPAGAMQGDRKGLVGGFEEIGFGARVAGPSAQPFDICYDDIAIGTARLGEVKYHREKKIAGAAGHHARQLAAQ